MREVPEPPSFGVTVDGSTVAVSGEIDIATADEFSEAVRGRLAAGPVLVDLREVVFLDSTGVRALNALLRECAENGWQMTICSAMSDSVVQVLRLTGMLQLLPLEDCEAP